MTDRADDLPPETVNLEQEDEEAQAQTVAQSLATPADGLSDSDKVKGGIAGEDDIEDLVDHMRQMERSGTIDMSAFAGEETMDDLENRYGKDAAPDADFADDDS